MAQTWGTNGPTTLIIVRYLFVFTWLCPSENDVFVALVSSDAGLGASTFSSMLQAQWHQVGAGTRADLFSNLARS